MPLLSPGTQVMLNSNQYNANILLLVINPAFPDSNIDSYSLIKKLKETTSAPACLCFIPELFNENIIKLFGPNHLGIQILN